MELDEVGKEKVLTDLRGRPTVKVVMAIKAPKGMCQLFEEKSYRHYNLTQCEAIKAFMEEHKDD